MDWSEKRILDILRLIEASDYDEVKLEDGDFKLHVRKRGAPGAEVLQDASVHAPQRAETRAAPERLAPENAPSSAPSPSTRDEPLPAGLFAVRSPMIGTFYRAPAPHAAPFVDTGASVCPDDTVCLIEVMKLFNTIKAGVAGKVVRILAHNAATVKKDEALFWIEPDEQ